MASQLVSGTLSAVRGVAANNGTLQTIFTQGANGLSSAQTLQLMTTALQAAGIKVPKGVAIGIDAAQIILAGGAIADDVATNASTLCCVGDIASGVGAVAALMKELGFLDPTADDFVNLGVSIAMAVSSEGTNVLADVGVIISLINVVNDLGPLMFGSSAIATAQAQANLANAVKATIAPQVMNAANLSAQYANGSLDLFDFIGQVAMNDPTQFATLFPGLAAFFPSWMPITLVGQGNSNGLFGGSHVTDTATFFSLVTNKKQVQDVLIENYLVKPMTPFETFQTVKPVISIQAVSVLGLILQSGGGSGDVSMGFNFNVIGAMRGLGITPAILGDDWLFKGLQRNENDVTDWQGSLPYPPLTLPYVTPVTSGTTVNGSAYLTPAQTVQNTEAQELIALQTLMQQYDAQGNIEALLGIPEAVALLKQYSNFHIEPTFYTLADYQTDLQNYQQTLQNYQTELASLGADPVAAWKTSVTALQAQINTAKPPTAPAALPKPATLNQAQAWLKAGATYQSALTAYQNNLALMKARLSGMKVAPVDPNAATRLALASQIASLTPPQTKVGEITNMKLVGTSITSQNWFSPSMTIDPATQGGQQFWNYVYANYTIDLADYWKCLNVLSQMQQSQLFADDTTVQDWQGSLAPIESLFKSAYGFVIQKQLNIRARANLAKNLGIPSGSLASRYSSNGTLIFYQKAAS